MRFVPGKSEEAQAVLTVHRARELLVGERIALTNQMCGLLGEFGITVSGGMARLRRVMREIGIGVRELPLLAKTTICELYERMQMLDRKALEYERRISRLARQSEAAKQLMVIAGVGPFSQQQLLSAPVVERPA